MRGVHKVALNGEYKTMKTYLITGASRGIGMATAKALAAQGHKVYGTYNAAKETAQQLESEMSGLKMYQVDLGDYASIDGLAASLKDVTLDGIVNSAGIFEGVDFDNFDITALEKNFRVNAFAPVYLTQACKDNLKDGSAVVNVSSTDAFVGSNVGMGYSASKAALSNLTLGMSAALAPRKIRVVAIAPGWIGDGMRAPQQLLNWAADYNPLKKLGTYEDMANLICFLLSDQAAYMNGTVIVADGGDMAKNYILEKESELLG
jgi:3-oxoacyl-[acyl-carrier protein] reductase